MTGRPAITTATEVALLALAILLSLGRASPPQPGSVAILGRLPTAPKLGQPVLHPSAGAIQGTLLSWIAITMVLGASDIQRLEYNKPTKLMSLRYMA